MNEPLVYACNVRWLQEKAGAARAAGREELSVAAPAALGGLAGHWSAEELLLVAVNTSLMSTFVSLADRAGLAFRDYRSAALGRVELMNGRLVFTSIALRPRILLVTPSDVGRTEDVLAKAEAHCIISTALKVPLSIEAHIE